jgi:hypothetical protein
MRNGVTLLIAQDPVVKDGERPEPRIRFVIPKWYSPEREERTRNYYLATGRATSSNLSGQANGGDARFQLNFGLLHAGI